ncbi:hypothetical protein SAMN05216344_1474 [Polaromonas sp. OV174]|uniref:hypothetical protein n=1 Tax=Polaromonas sp. OV174 TaxID=1855300 RepID=UPI0008EA916D|nr:hypothetical protein [Polaromonas sp. OV174]SFC79603.1 hypothetical protein SAMN05216344_1474 [Polaromonas sp. OV174]
MVCPIPADAKQATLQRRPIYRCNNAQAEKIAEMRIAGVRVENGKLRVTIDASLSQGAFSL